MSKVQEIYINDPLSSERYRYNGRWQKKPLPIADVVLALEKKLQERLARRKELQKEPQSVRDVRVEVPGGSWETNYGLVRNHIHYYTRLLKLARKEVEDGVAPPENPK